MIDIERRATISYSSQGNNHDFPGFPDFSDLSDPDFEWVRVGIRSHDLLHVPAGFCNPPNYNFLSDSGFEIWSGQNLYRNHCLIDILLIVILFLCSFGDTYWCAFSAKRR